MKQWLWPLVILFSAISTGVIALLVSHQDNHVSPALLITVWFLLVCPGMAFVRLFRFKHWLDEWTLAIALSLALGVLVPELMLYLQVWSPQDSLLVLIGLSLFGVVLQAWMICSGSGEYFGTDRAA